MSEPLLNDKKIARLNMQNLWRSVFQSSDGKPRSLPNNFPNHSEEDLSARPFREVSIGKEQDYEFCTNFVKTSKYEIWNFLPKFLLEEFNPKTKVANCYFLVISALQCIHSISNTGGYPTTLIPLIGVVTVDGFFQILEDIARHKADAEANASVATRFDAASKKVVEVTWAELSIGDLVVVYSRSIIPADIAIIGVSEKSSPPSGISYVETKSLDGETNLKIRNALPGTLNEFRSNIEHSAEFLAGIKGKVEMEHPNKLIETFSGTIDLDGREREPIGVNNVLLRGCVLRNTDWVVGLVINTGHDTKIMMSSSGTPSKTSSLESTASNEIQRIIILLAVVCITGATGEAIWNAVNNVEDHWYLAWEPNYVEEWVVKFFYFFLLHATFIPVSLYVSMSIARFFQSKFMNNDLEMYYPKTDTPALVRTMTLNEELGQISHIFSDKTGTLTCNVMDFRKASIAGVSYGQGITEIGKAAWKLKGKEIPLEMLEAEEKAKNASVPHVSFYCPTYDRVKASKSSEWQDIGRFFRILSICHDVIPEKVDGKVHMSASNPDDDALVCAAGYFGFDFVDREEKIVTIVNKELNRREQVEVLETIEFTSKRKRMSVVVRDRTNNTLQLMCKGADSAMMSRLASGQEQIIRSTNDHMTQYAVEGLRCLMICYKSITEQDFQRWHTEYKLARSDLTQIELLKKGETNRIEQLHEQIEQGLSLVGCTGIEDRLQDQVPETIATLAQAGIKIWMLTGDKEETAINIAVACNLVQPDEYMKQVIVNSSTAPNETAMENLFKRASKEFDEAEKDEEECLPRALIIDGPSLITAMKSDAIKANMQEFSKRCQAVVACRVSPDQKKEMVNMIKFGVPGVRTLAVGDGANDVAMIQAAHVGVGIKGEEGVQAVNSADFAIAQFRYLCPLLMKHGRYNYIRMSSLVIYMFYKNIFMSIAQFWFAFMNGFSGQKYYTEGGIQLFNLVFTTVPILLMGIYDMDIKFDTVKEHPLIYKECIDNLSFTPVKFWGWILHAVGEAVICALLPLSLMSNSQPGFGLFNSFWESGALCFTAVVIIANLKMFFLQHKWMWIHFVVILVSILMWFTVASIITSLGPSVEFDWYYVWFKVLANGSFWLSLLLICSIIVGKDIYFCGVERNFNWKSVHILQEFEIYGQQGSSEQVANSEQPAVINQRLPSPTAPASASRSGSKGNSVSNSALEMLDIEDTISQRETDNLRGNGSRRVEPSRNHK